jgi:hypothetical protein
MPSDSRTAPAHDSRPLPTLAWALFLGMSWTWCIGMFLPVLMVRELGFWGWVIFAVPNVLGAGAMGWVLRDTATSERLVREHSSACAAFSAVTILFQVTFAGWVVAALVGKWGGLLFLGTILVTVASGRWVRRGEWITALLVFLTSLSAFWLAVRWGSDLPFAGIPMPRLQPGGAPAGAGHPLSGLLYLAPVCVFGFLLCPYLDLTFHRARQRTSPRAGAVAFAVGFGGPFLLMIVFTFWYARLLAPLAAGQPATFLPERLRWAIAAHMAVQLGYTVGVHWAALGWRPPFTDAAKVAGGLLGFVAGLVPQALGLFADHLAPTRLSRGELVYRGFLAFYGLIFPAYAWLCMLPTPDGSGLTRRKLRVFAAAVIAAGPMFWLGFIERKMIWLLPGLAVVLLARLLLLRSDSAKSSRASLPRAAGIDSRR